MNEQSQPNEFDTLWLYPEKNETTIPLDSNIETEVCIIGGGIAGLVCAYLLLKAGFKITLIDKGKLFHGETGKTSAHLSNALDDRYFNLINTHGIQKAHLAAQSHQAAIELIEIIANEERIDCDFKWVNGYLFSPDLNMIDIEKEYEACKRLMLDVELTDLPFTIPGSAKTCLKFTRQAQFHPIKFLQKLALLIKQKGGIIHEMTQAVDINLKTNTIKLLNGHFINAKYIVQTSNFPVQCSIMINSKLESYRSYVIALAIPKGLIPTALYWDTQDPYHYVRVQANDGSIAALCADQDILIVGGEDHRVGSMPKKNPYLALENWVRDKIPGALGLLFHWSGQILEPVDYLAYLGNTPGALKNNFMITGDSGNGLTHGVLGATIIRDLIQNKSNPWQAVYDPSRLSMKAIKNAIINLSKSTKGYAGYISPGKISSANELAANEGAVMREKLAKVAVYRDEEGRVYKFSAICPHLKAIITWNSIDKTWDCPAHGSRFSAKGKLLNRPATCDLKCLYKPSI